MANARSDSTIRVVPTGGALGADIWGVDLESLSDSEFEQIHDAWLQHDGVVRIAGQFVAVEAMLEFASRFGELDLAPVASNDSRKLYRPDLPHLTVISNIIENGKEIGGLGSYESKWHSDMSYNDIPPKASVLQAVELPRTGGDTGYANMYQAYETLPDATKARVAGLTCKHDATRNSVGQLRRGYKEHYEDRNDAPGAVHPIVCTHPETGRRCLYLGRRALAFIPELSAQEGDSLLDELWAHASQEQFTWYQRWRVGDIVVWDNRCTMHRRDAIDETQRRLLHRTQIKGERPVAANLAA